MKQGQTIRKNFFRAERTSLKKFLGIPLNFKDELFKTIFGNFEINQEITSIKNKIKIQKRENPNYNPQIEENKITQMNSLIKKIKLSRFPINFKVLFAF